MKITVRIINLLVKAFISAAFIYIGLLKYNADEPLYNQSFWFYAFIVFFHLLGVEGFMSAWNKGRKKKNGEFGPVPAGLMNFPKALECLKSKMIITRVEWEKNGGAVIWLENGEFTGINTRTLDKILIALGYVINFQKLE